MADDDAPVDIQQFPERVPLPGPEIPDAEVDERGVFRFPNGKGEVYESARLEFPIAPLFEEETPIEWVWPERIALGMVTFLEGANSAGKTFVALDMAARVTRGAPWPGRVEGPQPAGDVLVVSGDKDGWERVVLPRLTRAGADVTRVAHCETVNSHDTSIQDPKRAYRQRRLSFPHDLPMLEYNIRVRPHTRLVVIDSLSVFCASDRAFRETLWQLDEIAARRNVAIVVTARPAGAARRLRPHESDPRAETTRAVFRVLVDPEDDTQHYLAPVRMSFCALPDWLPFQIVGQEAGRGVVAWGAPAETPPESAVPPNPARERGAIRRAVKEWLRTMLGKSDMPVTTVIKEATKCGFSEATLRRAREELKVRMYRDAGGPFSVGWWTLRPMEATADGVSDAVDTSAIQSWEPRPMSKDVSPRGGVETVGQAAGPDVRVSGDARESNGHACQAGKPDLHDEESERDVDHSSQAAWDPLQERLLAAILGSVMESGEAEQVPYCNGHSLSNGKHESNGRHDSPGDRPKPK